MPGTLTRCLLPALLAAPWCAPGADEGMWRPSQLPELAGRLKSSGVSLDPARLTDLTSHPMNAVISLGGCTASFVSPDGLAITNHHCANGSIQFNSTADRNLLETGFTARSRSEELPAAPGTRISVTVAVTDVTGPVHRGLAAGLSGRQRYQAIEDRKKELIAACEEDPGHRCRVAAYHGGLEYELIKQLEIRDVRLVHAPAGAIGNYGGDIDNWMWPRHTGDYSFYRAYVGPDGKPADRDAANVPYRPRHHLKVSTRGLKEGDAVLVAGYPGSTSRHKTAAEAEDAFEWLYPTRTRVNRRTIELVARLTEGLPDAAIKYATVVSGLSNTLKNNEGMLAGYERSTLLRTKQELERGLRRWIEADPEHRGRHLPALDELGSLAARERRFRERTFFFGEVARRGALFSAARTLVRLAEERRSPDAAREPGYQDRDVGRIRDRLSRMERTFDAAVDRGLWRQAILDYAALPADQRVAAFDEWFGIKAEGGAPEGLDARLDGMYAATRLGAKEARLALMEATAESLAADQDPFIRLAVALLPADRALEEEQKEQDGRMEAARAGAMGALASYLLAQGRPLYPDANGTLRVTYGTVKGYRPRDGVSYLPFTGLTGLLQKETGKDPFNSPLALLEAVRAAGSSRFSDPALGTVPVNFLSDVDSTGGNSGSPTLDGRGELAGLLFDGNWESMTSSWEYQPDVKRAIHVDIRYVLWVMEHVHGAGELLRELGVESSSSSPSASSR
ncbi:MAG TPA: S46 family peptidase [Candidatus Polarisedimenticolia bacterium]|nr:S46 family peptidase [Candidatus Polarisedimenticolia bacterium]